MDDDDPGMFDISGQIRKAVNDMVAWVAETGLRPILNTLGDTVLATPDLTANGQVRGVWTASLVLADALFVLFVVAAGFSVAARDTVQSRFGLKQTLPRLFVGALAANLSLIVCAKGIEVANAITAAIAGQGVDGAAAAAAIKQVLEEAGDGTNFLFSMLVIAALVMAIVVVLTFILRIAMLVILIGVAPIALLCHASPHSEGLAYAWWRAFAACLAIQLGQAAILVATLKVFLTPVGPTVLGVPSSNDGWLGILICVAMLWLLIKLPGWTRHFVLGGLGARHGRGLVGQVVRAVVMVKTLGASAGASRAAGSPAGSTRAGSTPARTSSVRGSASARRRNGATPATASKRSTPGPAAFSHAPVTQPALSQPAGVSGPVTFSHAATPAAPRPAPPGGVTPVPFSHPDTSPSRPAQPSRPAPVRFSNTSSTPAVRGPGTARPSTPPAASVFSATERPQTAPKRPPAPAAPVFSAPPKPTDSPPSRSAGPVPPVRRQPRRS